MTYIFQILHHSNALQQVAPAFINEYKRKISKTLKRPAAGSYIRVAYLYFEIS